MPSSSCARPRPTTTASRPGSIPRTSTSESVAATVEADFEQARLEKEVNEDLAKDGLVSNLILKQSTVRAESLNTRNNIEKERLKVSEASVRRPVAGPAGPHRSTALALQRCAASRWTSCACAPACTACSSRCRSKSGQQVAPGTNLVRVADPDAPEGRAAHRRNAGARPHDRPDRRRSTRATASSRARSSASTRPRRTARSPWTSRSKGELPRGARPDLSVDGTIELERLDNVLYVGRPAFGQEQSTVGLFKLDAPTGEAVRVAGAVGPQLGQHHRDSGRPRRRATRSILSDMSAWDQFERVRLEVTASEGVF